LKYTKCAQSATDTRIFIFSTVPNPHPNVDSRLLELDEAFKLIKMDRRSRFLNLRLALSLPVGVRSDCYQEKDIHLNDKGNRVVGLRIRSLLESIVSISAPRSINAHSSPPTQTSATSTATDPTHPSTPMSGTQVVASAFAAIRAPIAEANKAQEIALLKTLLLKYKEGISLQEVHQVSEPELVQKDTSTENDPSQEEQMETSENALKITNEGTPEVTVENNTDVSCQCHPCHQGSQLQ
jgi:hypothetical protein